MVWNEEEVKYGIKQINFGMVQLGLMPGSSNLMETQVFVSIEKAVVPVEDQVVPWNLLAPYHHKPQNFSKVCLAHGHFSWINVSWFECSEEKLSWCCIVGIRSHLHYRHIQSFQHLLSPCTFVVWCTVPAEDGVLSPVRILPVKLQAQLQWICPSWTGWNLIESMIDK